MGCRTFEGVCCYFSLGVVFLSKGGADILVCEREPSERMRYYLAVLLLLFCVEVPARAYTDPGGGLFLWQILAAGVVGVVFQIRKLKSWFRIRKRS